MCIIHEFTNLDNSKRRVGYKLTHVVVRDWVWWLYTGFDTEDVNFRLFLFSHFALVRSLLFPCVEGANFVQLEYFSSFLPNCRFQFRSSLFFCFWYCFKKKRAAAARREEAMWSRGGFRRAAMALSSVIYGQNVR